MQSPEPSPMDNGIPDLSPVGFFIIIFLLFLFFILICVSANAQRAAAAPPPTPEQLRQRQLQLLQEAQRRQQIFADLEMQMASLRNSQRPSAPPPPPYDVGRARRIAATCTECAICLGEYGSDVAGVSRRTLMPCGHRFHKVCIDAWFDKERGCPICRGVSQGSYDSVHGIRSSVG